MMCRQASFPTKGLLILTIILGCAASSIPAEDKASAGPAPKAVSAFDLAFDSGAVVSLKPAQRGSTTQFVSPGKRLGDIVVRFRYPGGAWQTAATAELKDCRSTNRSADGQDLHAIYDLTNSPTPLRLEVGFRQQTNALLWDIVLSNPAGIPVEIGDLALPLPMNSRFRRGDSIHTSVLKHSFISGHGSWLFWMRPDSAGPFLLLTPSGNTPLEYWDSRAGTYSVYIHSAVAGAEAKTRGCNWRQPNTSLTLAPRGQPGATRSYSFKFQWADNYQAVRDLLVQEGLIDVEVVPGMTLPNDLPARLALRTTQEIVAVEAEFPGHTRIERLATHGPLHLYQVQFFRLGENRLTVRYGNGRHMFLEFFSTEPLETLIKKRAAFIARCQHRDPAKWYDGLILEWNMETQTLLSPDNYDRIRGWRIYEVTCDDPGLSKPAFLAAKNAEFPVQAEVDALDYYVKHFVWGGLQRTTEETYPYGIYGIPDWKKNRESPDPGRNGRLHLWRVYDYPHVVLMYYSLYRVAKNHPEIKTELTAQQYLERAMGTAQAMFSVPYEIERWSAYETGFYNEVVLPELIHTLEAEGLKAEAGRLRSHWERKVQFFVNENPDLFGSEYPFDSTGFESTEALARYAVEHAGETLARGPVTTHENARRFMDAQMAANVFCRGWLEPAYYYMGSDYRGSAGNAYTLSYMSPMGGWAVLDYALYFATNPAPSLRLGFASCLSSWALMNTGTEESNYGYWYPGKANDGAAGGGFEPAPYGQTWLEQPHHRGAWYYACETDLGYCGYLRAAATILTDDPLFGRFCFGGSWNVTAGGIQVTPRDGVRRRFHARLDNGNISLVLDSARFADSESIVIKPDLSKIEFQLEPRPKAAAVVKLRVTELPPGTYTLEDGTGTLRTFYMTGAPITLDLQTGPGTGGQAFKIARHK